MINIVNTKLSNRQIRKATRKLATIKNGAPRAINAAINRTLPSARKNTSVKIREHYNVKAGDIKDTMSLKKSTTRTLTGKLNSEGSPLPLINFNVSPKKPPKRAPKILKAAVLKGGSKKGIPNTFTAKMKSGHIGVFERTSKASLPIEEKYAPSVPSMMNRDSIRKDVQKEANKTLKKRLNHEIKRLTKG